MRIFLCGCLFGEEKTLYFSGLFLIFQMRLYPPASSQYSCSKNVFLKIMLKMLLLKALKQEHWLMMKCRFHKIPKTINLNSYNETHQNCILLFCNYCIA